MQVLWLKNEMQIFNILDCRFLRLHFAWFSTYNNYVNLITRSITIHAKFLKSDHFPAWRSMMTFKLIEYLKSKTQTINVAVRNQTFTEEHEASFNIIGPFCNFSSLWRLFKMFEEVCRNRVRRWTWLWPLW